MKILLIESSPHTHGSSNLLAASFVQGAKEAGHEVTIFDAAHGNLHPCLACYSCAEKGECVQKDDMEPLKANIRHSDMLVFVTPLYYFGMSAQLKMVIDRFYSFNEELMSKGLKTALIAAEADDSEETIECLRKHYLKMCDYLHFKNQGMILGIGCSEPSVTKETKYPQKAYDFGKSL